MYTLFPHRIDMGRGHLSARQAPSLLGIRKEKALIRSSFFFVRFSFFSLLFGLYAMGFR